MTSRLTLPNTWPLRWRYAAGCFLLGVVYSLTALVVGVEATFRGVDVTLWVGGVIEASFAVFGYLLGLNAEARRRERRDAEVIESQLRDLAAVRARLAQAERLASLGELAGAIVHEVRNPLAIIRSMIQNLEESLEDGRSNKGDKKMGDDKMDDDEMGDDEVGESGESGALDICRQIRDEVDRLARVTSSLSAFSRRPTLRLRELHAARLAERVRLLASELLDERGVELRLVPPESHEPVVVDADEDLLTQVLLGLVENGAEASSEAAEERTVVRLGWRRVDEAVELTVSDDGAGVPEDLRERVFDPFFTTRTDGHGLGLAVARQIVGAHDGSIEVDGPPNEESRGATFRIRLPHRAAGRAAASGAAAGGTGREAT